jgi:hypothetical protein
MPNYIKYSISPESNSLRVGNFNIGVGDVPKGPTEVTGYWNGITPPSGGYTVYLNKETQGPSIYLCENDTDLLNLTKTISGNNFDDVDEAISWLNEQSDSIVVNKDYENIITNGLLLNLDSTFIGSYSGSGSSWKDLSGNGNNALLFNNPIFNVSLTFDGVNNYAETSTITPFGLDPFTISVWFKTDGSQATNASIICVSNATSANNWQLSFTSNTLVFFTNASSTIQTTYTPDDEWVNVVVVRNSTNESDTKIYINGVLNASGTANSDFSDLSGIRIGMNRGSNAFFKGRVASVQLYNRSIDESEILNNYNAIEDSLPEWILKDGTWQDFGIWIDTEIWND